MKWAGRNNFGALAMNARGGWESRQVKLNFTYLLGNSQVKGNRNRSTGIEDESKRVSSGKQLAVSSEQCAGSEELRAKNKEQRAGRIIG